MGCFGVDVLVWGLGEEVRGVEEVEVARVWRRGDDGDGGLGGVCSVFGGVVGIELRG